MLCIVDIINVISTLKSNKIASQLSSSTPQRESMTLDVR